MKTKLNIGSGARPMNKIDNEWLDLDVRKEIKLENAIYTPDFVNEADMIPVEDNTFEEVLAHSVLEHISKWDYPRFLKEWYRILQVGGRIRISVPDMYLVAKDLIRAVQSKNQQAIKGTINLIYGEQNYSENVHRWGWTEESLSEALKGVGFHNIKRLKGSRYPSELFIEAVK